MIKIGDTIGHLTIINDARRSGRRAWLCRCVCGNEHVVAKINLGSVKSCGCRRNIDIGRAKRTHGHTAGRKLSPTFISWLAMRNRCYNETNERYPTYGAVGVVVCDQWLNSFEAFLADMGERPCGKTIDRYPNRDGNYEPDNCRWATPSQQAANRRPMKRGNIAKTHCPSGHPYSGDNLRSTKHGRKCRECDRLRSARRRANVRTT
jgi:hypothetical protein